MSHIGKIASLPRPLREEVNHRMDRNVPARILAEWLNSLPEVQQILRDSFDGNPINEQNLCNWRQGGFQEWQTRREFLERLQLFSESAADIESAATGMADYAARLLSVHFAMALQQVSFGSPGASRTSSEPADSTNHDSPSSPPPPPRAHSSIINSQLSPLKPLYALTRAISSLRRGDHSAARLKLQHQAAARAAAKTPSSEPVASPPPTETTAPASENQGKSSLSHPNRPTLTPTHTLTPPPLRFNDSRFTIHDAPPFPSLPSNSSIIHSPLSHSSPSLFLPPPVVPPKNANAC
ncbi:MAG TPA: hypothetical protein VG796_05125 [Verrucomicrobiales bacterium]|nr:hypothetical protein [Verrucomicrobiales bacterium]